MELKNRRISSASEATLGTVFDVTGRPRFLCYALEDQYNYPKVPGETRIPPGRYQIKLRAEGRMHKRYSDRFPFHRGMLWLQDVPNFKWVYLHTGNTDDHSDGCVLLGDAQHQNVTERGQVTSSVAAYTRVYDLIANAIKSGKEVWITIEDYA